jgi:hypothetical protein
LPPIRAFVVPIGNGNHLLQYVSMADSSGLHKRHLDLTGSRGNNRL